MRDDIIRASAYKFLYVTDCTMNKKVNEHGTATISGVIEQGKEEEFIKTVKNAKWCSILIDSETKKDYVVFTGLVESVSATTKVDGSIGTIHLVGGTKLLDQKRRIRTFQNVQMTYKDVLQFNEKSYSDISHIMHEGNGKAIGNFIVQYEETDWAFFKRITSQIHSFLIPSYQTKGIHYYVGLPNKGASSIKPQKVKQICELDDFLHGKENGIEGIVEQDFVGYEVESRDFVELGDTVSFHNMQLYVYKAEAWLQGNELMHRYRICTKRRFLTSTTYNTKMIGASLDAKILAVSKDTVKVCIDVDGKQEESAAIWFPYSTVYSSPDGTGWYCMPEPGDRVRVYLPTKKEKNAYIISSIHMETGSGAGESGGSGASGGEPPRSNPDNKSIMNKYNKQIELTPSTITITNNNGMTILIDDSSGIQMISDKDIKISSKEAVEIASMQESLVVEAKESIELIQGSTHVLLKDDVMIEGATTKIQ